MKALTVLCGVMTIAGTVLLAPGCGKEKNVTPKSIPTAGAEYVVFAWNDLGMHCLNPTYDEAVLLPPYNTVWAQVVKRGDPPQIVTSGLTAEYMIVDNTYSYGKTDTQGGAFAQFWDHDVQLFGIDLALNTGLNLKQPDVHNGLGGTMALMGDHFEVDGMPVTPVDDAGAWSPYQVIEVTIKSGATVVAQTRATVPTSDEINCAKCHTSGVTSVFHNILASHDNLHATTLVSAKPVLCASCHGSPALGATGPGSSGKYLSQAIHGAHATRSALCMDCHPGATTRCNRSLAHTAADGHCTACHGDLAEVASSIAGGTRVPWVDEPRCATCHTGVAGVDTGATLYRNAQGHGGMSCPACHDSPHAMYPSREISDNYQPLHYQSSTKTIGSCGVCHENSRGEGSSDFGGQHGGTGGGATACRVCHTAVGTDTQSWPHSFQWKAR
jgi:hypothetical protein